MTAPILATKLYIPPVRPGVVPRPRLIGRLNEGLRLGRKLTLISAPAGFGKTTLLSSWIHQLQAGLTNDAPIANPKSTIDNQVAWLSLDPGDNDPARFLTYLVAALIPDQGAGLLDALQSPQPPPIPSLLTALINRIAPLPGPLILVLDDYHVIESAPVEEALAFLLQHLPAPLHLVIATRQDPSLPLARLRARRQLTELRAADLRFTPAEAATLLNQTMGLNLSPQDVAALERRTEGWIAGLQLAALALQGLAPGHQDPAGFIQSFTGSHRYVLDYLVEEVLHQQPERIQHFLLRTAILDRLCGPLCDAVCSAGTIPPASGQETLEYLECANLFIVPLDNERRWYRYHHLFAAFLRQRLHQAPSPPGEGAIAQLHLRASHWYEQNGLPVEAFHHAAAAHDIERAARLIESPDVPLHFRGAVTAILDWLAALPSSVLDARPSLWERYAALLLVTGQTTGVEEKLDAAEAALAGANTLSDVRTRNLVGQITAARATLALTRYQVETMIAQSRRALQHLHPDNLPYRTTAHWTLGFAYQLQGDRAAAARALTEAISLSQTSGDTFTTILAMTGLGQVQESENQLHPAAETYRRVLQLAGAQPLQIVHEAHLGLARTHYQWNDLQAAQQHGEQSLHLARQYDNVIDRFVVCEVFLARLKLARGDVDGASAILAEAARIVRRHDFVHRMPEVAAARILVLIDRGDLSTAAQLAAEHDLPLSQARVHLARGDPSAALAILEPLHQQMAARGWQDERLKVLVLQAVALQARGETDQALQRLGDALALAEPGGFIRIFVDAGRPVAQLLSAAAPRGVLPGYIDRLLAAFEAEAQNRAAPPPGPPPQPLIEPLIEPLSPRELEVLQLIAQGLSNREISQRLFIALSTVKGHNRKVYGKLDVNRRTEAVARARELGLL